MGEVTTLVVLSLAMLVGCYVAGLIPLVVTFSEEYMKLTTVLGAGLLIGTALAVIIPEGVHTVYSAATATVHEHVHAVEKTIEGAANKVVEAAHETEHEHGHEHTEVHTVIGISLLLGFIFMLLVDQLCGGGHSHGGPAGDTENGKAAAGTTQNRHKITATLGLVVHAAADGVALGAAASTSQTHIEMIVFIAIMLHKAPAAFGLSSFLLHEGYDKRRVRSHLAAFAASAPIAAVITYFGLSQQSKEILSTVNATGIAMLFSAGTFLYVATVHVLPEIAAIGQEHNKGFSKKELSAMVIGALLPACLSLGHHH